MKRMTFAMRLSAEKYLSYYQGSAKNVIVKAEDGRTLKFPANRLQEFVTKDGVEGRLEIVLDDENRIVSMRRL